jgi:hypothetical protein
MTSDADFDRWEAELEHDRRRAWDAIERAAAGLEREYRRDVAGEPVAVDPADRTEPEVER